MVRGAGSAENCISILGWGGGSSFQKNRQEYYLSANVYAVLFDVSQDRYGWTVTCCHKRRSVRQGQPICAMCGGVCVLCGGQKSNDLANLQSCIFTFCRAGGGRPLFVVVRGTVSAENSRWIPCGGGGSALERAAVCWSELVQIPLNSWWNELLWSSTPIEHTQRADLPFQLGNVHVGESSQMFCYTVPLRYLYFQVYVCNI